MFEFYHKEFSKLNNALESVFIDDNDLIKTHRAAFIICIEYLNIVKSYFLNHLPENVNEEIVFFKKIKPQFVSKLIYHIEVYNIESSIPNGSKNIAIKYYQNQLKKQKQFFDENRAFYRYYRTKSVYLDGKYFVRYKYDIDLSLQSYIFEFDPYFSSSHDFIVSKILANDLLQIFVEERLSELESKTHIKSPPLLKGNLQWTASKIAIIELIYALQSTNSINNGNTDIKDLARIAERIFKIDLGNYYHTFIELKARKNSRTKFLDLLKESLQKRMDESDK